MSRLTGSLCTAAPAVPRSRPICRLMENGQEWCCGQRDEESNQWEIIISLARMNSRDCLWCDNCPYLLFASRPQRASELPEPGSATLCCGCVPHSRQSVLWSNWGALLSLFVVTAEEDVDECEGWLENAYTGEDIKSGSLQYLQSINGYRWWVYDGMWQVCP